MKLALLSFLVCLLVFFLVFFLVSIGSGLMLLSVRAFPDLPPPSTAAEGIRNEIAQVQPSRSLRELTQIAKAISVKVFAVETWGTGTIIQRRGDDYWVLTNAHVLTPGLGHPLSVETSDRRRHSARAIATVNFQGNDLVLLSFRGSGRSYSVASWGDSTQLREGEAVFAAGFPLATKAFNLTTGQIKLLLPQPFKGGYQIGSTNAVQNGMSGGPLLNLQGQVIGINGRQAHPLWGNPYVFQDSSVPTATRQEQMRQLSWAIPLQTALPFISAR